MKSGKAAAMGGSSTERVLNAVDTAQVRMIIAEEK